MSLLAIAGLQVAFDDRTVLHGVDLQLQRGQFVALLGPNAAGKTTLLHAIAGIVAMRAGTVHIDGVDLMRDQARARNALGVGVAPHLLPGRLTGRECLRLFAGARALPDIPRGTLDLAEALDLASMLDRTVSHYSLGTRQKLGILLGLLGTPPLLLLDEPINGLDPLTAHALKDHLRLRTREHGDTVLMATHALDVAERFVDCALLMIDGHLRHAWNAAALDAIRRDPLLSLEGAMVAALRNDAARVEVRAGGVPPLGNGVA